MRLRIDYLNRNYFLLLLPFYFVFHGYIQNMEAMRVADGLWLFLKYLLITVIVFGLSYLLLRSKKKAAVFSFFLLLYELFFGVIHDGLKAVAGTLFISQYAFLLPASLVGFVMLFIYLRKAKRSFEYGSRYLNVMLLLLILIDIPKLVQVATHQQAPERLAGSKVCDTCARPDIYFIVADEYADSASLQQGLNYNNADFQSALRSRGFHIMNSSSNYNFTPFAVASLVQMNYLTGIEGSNSSLADKNRCYRLINKSPLWTFLKEEGYEIKNYSIFNLDNIPTPAPQNYIMVGADMIETQTFFSRLNKDLRYHLATTFKIKSEVNRVAYFVDRCNQLLLGNLLQETGRQATRPRFIYTHLFMPHYPYYYDKDGTPFPLESLKEGQQINAKNYLSYLQYCNGVFLKTIDRILKNSKKPPVILFMGDHGFREYTSGFVENSHYYYKNLNTVLLPNGDYSKFYDGISSVNQFRVLLNTCFAQKLPLLKDTSILVYD